jgi:hypothetical protein
LGDHVGHGAGVEDGKIMNFRRQLVPQRGVLWPNSGASIPSSRTVTALLLTSTLMVSPSVTPITLPPNSSTTLGGSAEANPARSRRAVVVMLRMIVFFRPGGDYTPDPFSQERRD